MSFLPLWVGKMDSRNGTDNFVSDSLPQPGDGFQTLLLPMLETFVPGLSIATNVMSSYFHFDITYYLVSICVGLVLTMGINHCVRSVWRVVSNYVISTAEIRYDDEIYNYLMFWVSKQSFSSKTTQFVAGTQTNSWSVWTGEDDSGDGEPNEEEWDANQLQLQNLDKLKAVHYTPSAGLHFFWYRGRLLAFNRLKEESQVWFGRSSTETVYISCLGRSTSILKDLLQEAQISYHQRDGNRTVIYRGSKPPGGSGDDMEWLRCLSRPPRPLSTVVLDEAQKDMVVSDMREYLHSYTRKWYSNRGLPYRRGYLFHGPPGTGKTSLCFAVAGLLNLRIYVVSLNSRSLSEDSLAKLFHDLPWRCIVLLEDIDSAGITAKRTEEPKAEVPEAKESENKPPTGPGGENSTNPKGITLSAFLNIIDGVASSEGRILVMTTNHIEKLDPAILRPGRVDMTVRFRFADSEMMRGIFRAIYGNLEKASSQNSSHNEKGGKPYARTNGHTHSKSWSSEKSDKAPSSPTTLLSPTQLSFKHHDKSDDEIDAMADIFAEKMPSNEFTPAELQGYLLRHKYNPQEAIDGIEDFVKTIREEKMVQKTGI
jgi:mitochondrial chaperone BCS1